MMDEDSLNLLVQDHLNVNETMIDPNVEMVMSYLAMSVSIEENKQRDEDKEKNKK